MTYEPTILIDAKKIKIKKTARVDSFCKIEGGDGVRIGSYVHIASFSHINVGGGSVVFEKHSGCSSHCCVGGASSDWSYLHASAAEPAGVVHKRKYVTRICKYALLFMGVIVLPGRTVGEGAVVLPGTVVDKDVEPWSIVKGNPMQVVGQRVLHENHRCIDVSQLPPLSGEIFRADDGIAVQISKKGTFTISDTGLWGLD